MYGGYAEANRAPTPAELACADPNNPCLIESFLTADPPLKQVVSRTFEAGLRGDLANFDGDQRLSNGPRDCSALSIQDDIITIAAQQERPRVLPGMRATPCARASNLECSIKIASGTRIADYAYVDATFQTANVLSSLNNPAGFTCPQEPAPADEATCIQVNPGDTVCRVSHATA